MKKSSYMDRALKSRDPRYAKILGKLGYDRRDMVADADKDVVDTTIDQAIPNASLEKQFDSQPETEDDILKRVRAEYESVIGKKPYYGWGVDVLRERIDKAKGEQ